jgi:hypothetical protein
MADLLIETVDAIGVAKSVAVNVELTDLNGQPVSGFVDDVLVARSFSTSTDAEGHLTLDLTPNADIDRPNTYWTVVVGNVPPFLIEKGSGSETLRAAVAVDPAELGAAFGVSNLADVDLEGLTDGQVLVWDADAELWVPGTASGGGGGTVETVSGSGIVSVDDTDPANPVVSVDTSGLASSASLATEAATRAAADTALATSVTNEATARSTGDATNATAITTHINDPSAAHAASAVSVDPTDFNTMEGTDTQAALEAADFAIALALASATAAQSGLGAHVGAATDAHNAAAVSVAPDGDIASEDVQSALLEVDSRTARSNYLGGVPTRPRQLDRWLEALEDVNDAPVDVLVYGDSTAEVGNLTTERPWPWILSDVLARYTQNDPPVGYVFASATQGPTADDNTGVPETEGFAIKSSRIGSSTHVGHTAYCDRVSVIYRTSASAGTITIRDGGPGGTILATFSIAGADSYSNIWTSAALTPAVHQIYVSASGGANFIEGFYFYRGNYDKGVRVWPCVKGGATSETAVVAMSSGYGNAIIPNLDNLALVVYGTGINDYGDYDEWMRDFIDTFDPLIGDASRALWIPYILPTADRWTKPRVELARAIAGDYDLATIDASIGVPQMSVAGSSLKVDSTHPNGAGSRRIGLHASAVLAGDPLGLLLSLADLPVIPAGNDLTIAEDLTVLGTLGVAGTIVGFGSLGVTGVASAAAATGPTHLMRLSQRTPDDIYGDGSDGDLAHSGTTTLTRDMQYNNVSGTGTINTAGWRVMIRGTLTGSITFNHNGAAASGTTGGVISAGWYTSMVGGDGGTTTGGTPGATSGNRCVGVTAGTGGTGSSGAGAGPVFSAILATSVGVPSNQVPKIHPRTLWTGRTSPDNASPRSFVGGSGGGGGGGDGTAGGGGGAGGGVCPIFAYDASGFTGTVSANGGNGASPAAGNRGGGAGGGGGLAALVTAYIPTGSYTVSASGGTGAAGTGTGTAGTNGSTGYALTLQTA